MKKSYILLVSSLLILVSSQVVNAEEKLLQNEKPNLSNPFQSNDNTIDGNSLSERIKITDIAVQGTKRKEAVSIAMFLKPGDIVTPTQIREDLQRVFGLGYFSDVNATREPYKEGYRLIIQVVENPELSNIDVTGNTVVESQKILDLFEQQKGKIINLNNIKESIESLRSLYVNKGYQAVTINPKLTPDGNINLFINEGIIEEIKIVGNTETKNYVIMREIRQKPGDVFNIDIIREDLRRVYNTNFFENVDIKPSAGKENPNHIILEIVIKEKSTGNINLGAGYNNRDGIVGTFSVAKDNFFGTGQRIGLDLQIGAGWLSASGANWLGKIDWYEPWFFPEIFGARTGVGASLYKQRQGNFFQRVNSFNLPINNGNASYNYSLIDDRTGFSLSVNRAIFGDPLTSPWRTSLSVRAEQIAPALPRVQDVTITQNDETKSYNDLEKSEDPKDKESITNINKEFETYVNKEIAESLTISGRGYDNRVAVGLSLSYDTRDFAADPRTGWNNVISVEPSFGDVNYWKFFGTLNKYTPIPFFDKLTFAVGGRLGILTGEKISIYERFYSGGFDTIRGWPENGYLNGERVFVGSAEVRFPIYNIVSGVVFFDFGNFWNQSWQVTTQNVNEADPDVRASLLNPYLRYGFGLGLRVNTPLGALRADYGIRDITRPFDLSRGAQFHFNIGQKF